MAAALPHDNSVIFYADLNAIRQADLLAQLVGTKSVEELDYRKFVTESGFDYKTDLDRFAIAFQDKSRFAVAVGRFDWTKIKNYALQSKAQCTNGVCEIKGNPLENLVSFYPMQGSALAMASTPNPGGVYSVAPNKTAGKLSDPWPTTAPVWIWVPGSIWRDPSKLPTGAKLFASALAPSTNALFTVEPTDRGKNLTLQVSINCTSEQDAKKVLQQLEEATTLLRKMLARDGLKPTPADLAGLLINGKFQIENTRVRGQWPLEMALIRSIAEGNVE